MWRTIISGEIIILDIKNWKSKLVFTLIFLMILALTLFSGCLEKNPIDNLIEKTHEEVDPDEGEKGDYQKQKKALDPVEKDQQSGEPENQKDAANVEIQLFGEGKMGYDDGELDKQTSLGDRGQAVFFSSNGKLKIHTIKIFSARSGDDMRLSV